jgi:hypothetical protein
VRRADPAAVDARAVKPQPIDPGVPDGVATPGRAAPPAGLARTLRSVGVHFLFPTLVTTLPRAPGHC